MSTIEQTTLPTGTWSLDPVHSGASFSVDYAGLGAFVGRFRNITATLADGVLTGEVDVTSVDIAEETFKGHLLAPDFFDAEAHPTITFRSTEIRAEGDRLVVEGDLTVKGHTERVAAVGRLAGPVETPFGQTKIGIDLAADVDRNAFGLKWNAPMPGGGSLLGDEVTLTVNFQLARQGA